MRCRQEQCPTSAILQSAMKKINYPGCLDKREHEQITQHPLPSENTKKKQITQHALIART